MPISMSRIHRLVIQRMLWQLHERFVFRKIDFTQRVQKSEYDHRINTQLLRVRPKLHKNQLKYLDSHEIREHVQLFGKLTKKLVSEFRV